jgi:hypothetical protein
MNTNQAKRSQLTKQCIQTVSKVSNRISFPVVLVLRHAMDELNERSSRGADSLLCGHKHRDNFGDKQLISKASLVTAKLFPTKSGNLPCAQKR